MKNKLKYEKKLFLTDPFYGFFRICAAYPTKKDKNFLGLEISFIKKLRIIYVTYERLEKNLEKLKKTEFNDNNIKHAKLTVVIAGDIETFILQTRAFLDISAKLLRYFYKEHIRKFRYLTEAIEWFKKHPLVDEEFYEYLKNNMSWFDEFNKKRGDISHSFSLDVFWNENNKKERFGFAIYSLKEIGTEDLGNFLDKMIDGLNNYLKFYVEHFEKKMIRKK
jgi:hypothetical protein